MRSRTISQSIDRLPGNMPTPRSMPPELRVAIHREAAAAFGIRAQQVQSALGATYGGQQISTICGDASQYLVLLPASVPS